MGLIVPGGIRSGADVADALALGADAVWSGVGALIALGCDRPSSWAQGAELDATAGYRALGTAPGYCSQRQTGRCPVCVTAERTTCRRGSTLRSAPGR